MCENLASLGLFYRIEAVTSGMPVAALLRLRMLPFRQRRDGPP